MNIQLVFGQNATDIHIHMYIKTPLAAYIYTNLKYDIRLPGYGQESMEMSNMNAFFRDSCGI